MPEELFDPREISKEVYHKLSEIRSNENDNHQRLKEQYSQSVELYTYLATWGMLRLKAEEFAPNPDGKRDAIIAYFQVLTKITEIKPLLGENSLDTLIAMEPEDYLGFTGLGLQVAREFAFWALAVYADVKAEAESAN
ncbi:hypothetical protein [Oscillatoria salina]|uniref:hypothetical protein n=1 Tax=Oscillatoria salina TaxID=331517 RepID=UPI001CCA77DC|nr:hypothetical protein [Oscillatoria salina]MBZ8180522.1 hypothetical protein [Oscillatoria salina IIICB1]